jgi:hypothetical protein
MENEAVRRAEEVVKGMSTLLGIESLNRDL